MLTQKKKLFLKAMMIPAIPILAFILYAVYHDYIYRAASDYCNESFRESYEVKNISNGNCDAAFLCKSKDQEVLPIEAFDCWHDCDEPIEPYTITRCVTTLPDPNFYKKK